MFKYQKLADYLKTLINKKCQIKEIIYNDNSQKVNPAVAYSNLSLILNNVNKFEEMFTLLCKSLKKKKQKPVTNKYLLFVMVAELLNTGKIVGGGQIKKIILDHSHLIPQIQVSSKMNRQRISIRLRKNNQKIKKEHKKWKQIMQTLQQNLTIPKLFTLTQLQYSKLTSDHPQLRQTPACVIQSFSSNLPPFVLFKGLQTQKNKNIKFDVIDACSAPGNKTLQLSESLGQRGTVFAFEKDERRFGTLCNNMDKYFASNVKSQNKNFLQVDPVDPEYKKVKLILLDPSCSGSGMLTNFTRDGSIESENKKQQSFEQFVRQKYDSLEQKQKERVQSLKKFQLELLDHASKFRPLRLSYSTCSIFVEQNQQVVQQFLSTHPEYEMKDVWDKLNTHQSMVHGFKDYQKCIRIDPRQKISDGFFVCIFSRKKI